MIYELDLEMITELFEHLIKKAKKINGTLVLLNKTSDLADESVIENITHLTALNVKKNDFLEVTIYDRNDDDIFYEEFLIGTGKDYTVVKTLFIDEKVIKDRKNSSSTLQEKSSFKPKSHPFAKFIKK